MAHIYLYVQEKKRGPFSESDVKSMFAEGTVTPETPYWNEEMSAWRPLGRIENLAGKFRDPSTSIVPPRRTSAGQSNLDSEQVPLGPREKGLEIKKRSARNPQITVSTAIMAGILFFIILGAMFHLATLVFPDIQAQWKAESGGGP